MKKQLTLAAVAAALVATGTVYAGGCNYKKGGMGMAAYGGYQNANYVRTYGSYGGYHQGKNMRTGGSYGYGKSYAMPKAKPDIVDTAVAAGTFNTLVKAVQAAGLVDVLKGDGPYTVFAPTDAAFAKLPAGTLESLLADKEKLAQVLKYHVVPGKLDAGKVTSMSALQTAAGADLPVDSIKIATTDIMTSNGVIHVIDEVLIPAS